MTKSDFVRLLCNKKESGSVHLTVIMTLGSGPFVSLYTHNHTYISSKSVLRFLPFMESLFAGFGVLAQISLPRILDSLTAKTISL